SPYVRHYSGNHCYFLLLRLLRCFSSARSRILQHTFSMLGCPIRKPPDRFLFADPRCLSQLITSFFASGSLGIPRVPFSTFFPPYPFAHMGGALLRCVRPRKPQGHRERHTCRCLLLCFFFQYVKERFPQIQNEKFKIQKPATPALFTFYFLLFN